MFDENGSVVWRMDIVSLQEFPIQSTVCHDWQRSDFKAFDIDPEHLLVFTGCG